MDFSGITKDDVEAIPELPATPESIVSPPFGSINSSSVHPLCNVPVQQKVYSVMMPTIASMLQYFYRGIPTPSPDEPLISILTPYTTAGIYKWL